MVITTIHGESARRLLGAMAYVLCLSTGLGLSAGILPEGRNVIRNGELNASRTRPEYWVTRDSANIGTIKLIPPKTGELLGVLRIDVERESERPWTLELRQKIDSVLKKGETLYLTFEYHMTADYAFHLYWQQDSHPWPKYLALRIGEPAEQWAKCMVAVPVHEEMPIQSTSLSFHLAEKAGTVQFRNFVGIAVPADVDPQTLETNVEAVFGGDYYDNDWRTAALKRLDNTRKTDIAIVVTDASGPVADAEITVTQKDRDFSFGTEVQAALVADGALKQKFFADLRDQLGPNTGHLPELRAKITDRRLFDTITFPKAMIWRMHQAWGKEIVPQAIEVAKSQGLRVRGHTLYCPAFHFAPPKCRQMDGTELRSSLDAFIRQHATIYAGKVDQWDVLHGVLTYDEIYDFLGVDTLVNAFAIAREADPKAELLLSDVDALTSPADSHLGEVVELANWLRAEGAEVAGITLRASLRPPFIGPQAMEKRLDLIAGGTGLPIHVAGLEMAGAKANTQAKMLKDLLLAFYANAAVKSVSFSSIWAAATDDPRTALYLKDMKRRPASTMLETLLTEEWWTNEAKLKTDADGICRLSAFHGLHTVTIIANGKRIEKEVHIVPGQIDPGGKWKKRKKKEEEVLPPPGQIVEVVLK